MVIIKDCVTEETYVFSLTCRCGFMFFFWQVKVFSKFLFGSTTRKKLVTCVEFFM
jgi:hypothetical protein